MLQNLLNIRKRLKGAPTSGTVSIVVTDIADFSGVCVPGCSNDVQIHSRSHTLAVQPIKLMSNAVDIPFLMNCRMHDGGDIGWFYMHSTHFPLPSTACAELMKVSPEPMLAALVSHNSLVEKAKWANFGSVIEQEGGSFCLIFSEAGDAVKFCLQVARTALKDGLS